MRDPPGHVVGEVDPQPSGDLLWLHAVAHRRSLRRPGRRPGLTVIGLPPAALGEARDRLRATVVKSGQAWPSRRITLALSLAWLPKRGSGVSPVEGVRMHRL